jgi:hypothetical protein
MIPGEHNEIDVSVLSEAFDLVSGASTQNRLVHHHLPEVALGKILKVSCAPHHEAGKIFVEKVVALVPQGLGIDNVQCV